MQKVIENAIRYREVLRLTYDGHLRIVKPIARGFSSAKKLNLKVFQVEGTAESGHLAGECSP